MNNMEWHDYIQQVWETMRDFQTSLADLRVSLKGFLNAGYLRLGLKVGAKLVAQLKVLGRVVDDFETQEPTLGVSGGNFE